MAKKTVIVEENQDDVLYHPRVIAQNVSKLENAMREGFAELKTEIHNQGQNFATQVALESAKREAETKHDELKGEIAEVRREARRANRIIGRVGWLIISVVILTVLAFVGYNVGVHHS